MSSPESFLRADAILRRELVEQRILFGGQPLPTSLKPHLIPRATGDAWVRDTDRFMDLVERCGQALLAEPSLYQQLHLPPRARALFDIDPGYRRIATITRTDMVWRGRQTHVLELNSDSPAMMTYADRVQALLGTLFPLASLPEGHRLQATPRTRMLMDALVDCYLEWGGTSKHPTIALVDWPGVKTIDEQRETAREFTSLGCPSIVCAPHELSVHDGRLYAQGRRIDVVQRRILFPDFIERADELEPLLTAYRRGTVCMVNSLRSYLVGTKTFLALFGHQALTMLSRDDAELLQRLLPTTRMVDDDMRERLAIDRLGWVIKPAYGHGGKDVVLGPHVAPDIWQEALANTRKGTWVAQAYQEIPTLRLPQRTADGGVVFEDFYVNWNPFYFGGRFAGGLTRAARIPIVGITAAGALLPTIAVERLGDAE